MESDKLMEQFIADKITWLQMVERDDTFTQEWEQYTQELDHTPQDEDVQNFYTLMEEVSQQNLLEED